MDLKEARTIREINQPARNDREHRDIAPEVIDQGDPGYDIDNSPLDKDRLREQGLVGAGFLLYFEDL